VRPDFNGTAHIVQGFRHGNARQYGLIRVCQLDGDGPDATTQGLREYCGSAGTATTTRQNENPARHALATLRVSGCDYHAGLRIKPAPEAQWFRQDESGHGAHETSHPATADFTQFSRFAKRTPHGSIERAYQAHFAEFVMTCPSQPDNAGG